LAYKPPAAPALAYLLPHLANGAVIGSLGGLIGRGGGEFRLPLLMDALRLAAPQAAIFNDLGRCRVGSAVSRSDGRVLR
jgi:hypothetical protein